MRAALVAFLVLPVLVFAQEDAQAKIDALLKQIAELQAQLNLGAPTSPPVAPATGNATAGGFVCPSFIRSLQRGSEGDDVRELQKILASGGYLNAEPTGYFGAMTEKALGDFQMKAKVVAAASPAAGWGIFGPKTRAYFAKLCNDEIVRRTAPPVSESAPACVPAPEAAPSEGCGGYWMKMYDSKNCHVGWKCFVSPAPVTGNKPPVIANIDGPTSLSVGSTGVWTVNASDPEGGTLKYSVIWGDEGASSILTLLAGVQNPSLSFSSRLTHAYAQPGHFTFGVTVHDGVGNTSSARFAVAIVPRTASSTPTATVEPVRPGSCLYTGSSYPEGTETEGYNVNDLCLATNKVCLNRGGYVPKFKCTDGAWKEYQVNQYPNLPNYANMVGSRCAPPGTTSRGRTTQVVVHPATLLCRHSLCATTQNFAPVSLTCEYEVWVDWGIFNAGATSTGACAEPTPCEYHYGSGGKACASKQNGACPVPKGGHPLGT